MMSTASKKTLALITGAGHRLGKHFALSLAAMGYTIAVHYHTSRAEAEQTQAAIQAIGGTAYLFEADLTEPSQVAALFSRLQQVGQPLSVLVNSAAEMVNANLLEMPVEDWDHLFALNLRAPWLCAKQAASIMPAGSSIINITDAGAGHAWLHYAAYSISKSSLETLTRLLARSLAPNIRVNAIAPGLILPPPTMPPTEWQRLVARLPLQTAGSPENLSQALAFLLENTYITGQILTVDGGYQLI